MPTYDPKEKTKYFVRQGEVENWIEEQYDVPFNVPADLAEFGSPEGDFTVSVDGEVSEWKEDDLEAYFDKVEELKDEPGYRTADSRLLTEPFMNKLAQDGHIPEGEYVISLSY
jgi:hypothetical protein